MFSYFKGQVVQIIKAVNSRYILILEVNQIAYEIQITSHLASSLNPEESSLVQIFTHLQVREDIPNIYGFATSAERDIFRQLIGVSGIGAQLGLSLIDSLGLPELVQAIVSENVRTLVKTPGIGQKTAERLILELKTKLAQWSKIAPITVSKSNFSPPAEVLGDLEMTLLALGYESKEIEQAIYRLCQDERLLKSPHVEEWIKRAIAELS